MSDWLSPNSLDIAEAFGINKIEFMNAKEHYDNHLANFYSWMIGDIEPKIDEFKKLLLEHQIIPLKTKKAIDLGAGHGIQSIALKESGFDVTAVDFNAQLLSELRINKRSEGIKTIQSDIRKVSDFEYLNPEIIVCCGDTITHLFDRMEIKKLISDAKNVLSNCGYLILSFRDYSEELSDIQRFIPVKSTANRILTCVLEYGVSKVKVTDLLYERSHEVWKQKVSSYKKVRISKKEITDFIENLGMTIQYNRSIRGMNTIIAKKGRKPMPDMRS